MPAEKPNRDLKALESALMGLQPSAPQLDRDRIMYRAGRAGRVGWLNLLGMSFCMGAITASVVWFFLRPSPEYIKVAVERPVEKRVHVPVVVLVRADPPSETPPSVPRETSPGVAQGNYLKQRNDVLNFGVGMLKEPRFEGQVKYGNLDDIRPERPKLPGLFGGR